MKISKREIKITIAPPRAISYQFAVTAQNRKVGHPDFFGSIYNLILTTKGRLWGLVAAGLNIVPLSNPKMFRHACCILANSNLEFGKLDTLKNVDWEAKEE